MFFLRNLHLNVSTIRFNIVKRKLDLMFFNKEKTIRFNVNYVLINLH